MQETRKILIVDDEPVLRSLLSDNLTNEGFLVETAECAKTALDRIRNNNYHLVILDLALPDMNGILLCQKIQQNHPELRGKIIFITGIGLDDNTSDHLKALAGAYLAKPFELNSLNQTVRRLRNPEETVRFDTTERV
jgi:DNA-binding response OmpR family regulator